MKTENVEKAIDLLYKYHYADKLLKESEKTQATVAVLFDKINNTNNEAEQFHYRKDITDSIQDLISNSKRDGGDFEHDVLVFGLGIAITKLEYKLKYLKHKIEQL